MQCCFLDPVFFVTVDAIPDYRSDDVVLKYILYMLTVSRAQRIHMSRSYLIPSHRDFDTIPACLLSALLITSQRNCVSFPILCQWSEALKRVHFC